MYNTNGEWSAHDIRSVKPEEIPKADLWTFGFPCQDISIAGKQNGIDGKRSSLFYEVIRLLKGKNPEDRPEWLLVENVKNLLSINGGRGFTEVLYQISEAGYDCEWSVLNSKDFGVPQNRERVFIIGHLREKGSKFILLKSETGEQTNRNGYGEKIEKILDSTQRCSVIKSDGLSPTVAASDYKDPIKIIVPCMTPNRISKKQNGRRFKENGEPMFTLTAQDQHGVLIYDGKECHIRRLTPRECFRLQGFSDEQFEKAQAVNSASQLYKQAGNAVTVPVIEYIGNLLNEKNENSNL